MRVLVPLGKKEAVGIIFRICGDDEILDIAPEKLRPVIAFLDSTPLVTTDQLALWQWISQYYLCPIGDVLAAALPSKALDRQYLLEGKHRVRLPQYLSELTPKHPLTSQQQRAIGEIHLQWEKNMTILLEGVTSSGKTEVYIHLIEEQLQAGRQVLYMVPEIALTAQLTDRLQRVFGNRLLVYHSRVTDAQRMETYRQLLMISSDTSSQEDGVPSSSSMVGKRGLVIIGARSAVFLPLKNLGLIILDEEHESSYKQQDPAPRYHARSVAMIMAQRAHAKVLLGTATPSMETRYNAEQGKYGWVRMTERFHGLSLPRITMIDLQRQYHRKEMYGHFSDPLVARVREELQKGKQIILFQNRRGYAPYIQCTACGQVPKCPQCDVALTLHKTLRYSGLQCHYCGSQYSIVSVCQECGGEMKWHGFGTERLEDEAASLFPGARVERMDFDSTRKKDAYHDIIQRFSNHEVDILIGTQMVTKGLDFNDVSLVAVLNADHLLNTPSFRSYERAYQMLEQVAGRAGRKGDQGEVMIQTFDPNHLVFEFLKKHDGDGFYRQQIKEREQFRYPPFYRLIGLILRHRDEQKVEEAATALHQRLTQVFGDRCSAVITPSVARVQNLCYRQLQVRIETSASVRDAKRLLMQHTKEILSSYRTVTLLWDVDP